MGLQNPGQSMAMMQIPRLGRNRDENQNSWSTLMPFRQCKNRSESSLSHYPLHNRDANRRDDIVCLILKSFTNGMM
jgi:hypothetical protein